jgi:hypothetical protein
LEALFASNIPLNHKNLAYRQRQNNKKSKSSEIKIPPKLTPTSPPRKGKTTKKTMRKDIFDKAEKAIPSEINSKITKAKEMRYKQAGKSKMSKAMRLKQLQTQQTAQNTSLEKEYNGQDCLTQYSNDEMFTKSILNSSKSQETQLQKCSLSTDSLKAQSSVPKVKSATQIERCANIQKETAKSLAKRASKGNVKDLRCKLQPRSRGKLITDLKIKSIPSDEKACHTTDTDAPACKKLNGSPPLTLNNISGVSQDDSWPKHSPIHPKNKHSLAFSKPPNGSRIGKRKGRGITALVSAK